MYNELEVRRELTDKLGPGYPETMRPHGQAIRDHRKNCKLTQGRLGDLVGIDQTRVSHIERGTVDSVYTEYLYVWMKALGCACITELGSFDPSSSCSAAVPDTEEFPAVRKADQCVLDPAHWPDVSELNLTRTLIHPKTCVTEIYHPLRLSKPGPASAVHEALVIVAISEFPQRANIVLGTAGQGKSLFLRSLALAEAAQKRSFPLWIELRQLREERLSDHLLRRLRAWNLCDSHQGVERFAASGKLSLFLDALDELPVEFRQNLIDDLDRLHQAYPDLSIVMTARPEVGSQLGPWLTPYRIAPLERPDVEALIRTYAQPAWRDVLLSQMDAILHLLQGGLRTPIFVVLLVIHVEHTQQLPATPARFYRGLFDSLLHRHQQKEGTAGQPTQSGLSAGELEQIFKRLSYLVQKRFGSQPLLLTDLRQMTQQAMQKQETLPEIRQVERVLEDIQQLTQLLYAEGGYGYYIHNTVREFFAAAHLAEDVTHEHNRSFYTDCLKKWSAWTKVLAFLEEVDESRFREYFLWPDLQQCGTFEIPQLCRTMNQVTFCWVADDTLAVTMFNSRSYALAARQVRLQSIWKVTAFLELLTALNPEYVQSLQQTLEEAKQNPRIQCGVLLTSVNRKMTDIYYSERFLTAFQRGIDARQAEPQIGQLRVMFIRMIKAMQRAEVVDHDYRL